MDGLPWTDSTAYALTDLNLPNYRLTRQWLAFARAADVGAVRDSAAAILGIPWVNTLAADAHGGALYADYSVKAYVTEDLLDRCAGSATAQRMTARGVVTLDGSTTACDPGTDPAAPQPGILPPDMLPVLERSDYVANSNNSYWLTNPDEPLTGLPLGNGPARAPLSFRAQSGLRTIEARLAGRDGLPGDRFDHDAVKALVFGHPAYPEHGNRNRAAEVMVDAVVRACADGPSVTVPEIGAVEIAGACQILARWDRRHSLRSVGGHVFREFRRAARGIDGFWTIPFDPDRPLETPAAPAVDVPAVRTAVRQALGQAVHTLGEHGIPIDRPWGDVHFHPVGDTSVPVRGGNSGVLNLMITPRTDGGYAPVVHGASYVQIVGFDDQGPNAHAVLLYGQSTDPASPFHYDQLRELWTPLEWLRLPFTPAEIEAAAVSRLRLRE
jgi:acyl-homoserine-lactone acylase